MEIFKANQTQNLLEQIQGLGWILRLRLVLIVGLVLIFLILAALSDSENNIVKDNQKLSSTDLKFVKDNFNGTIMVKVPAGSFEMGSRNGDVDEKPVSTQYFTKPFWIDETEVTRGAYQSCVVAGKCTAAIEGPNKFSKANNQPINYITWHQASTYCKWREARLPTEAEWEYAARGPSQSIYPWGNDFNSKVLNYSGSLGRKTLAVGSYPDGASWVGALDMAGNVWEWTSSLFKDYPYDANDSRVIVKGTKDRYDKNFSENVVLRGGSFNDTSSRVRSAYRLQFNSADSNYSLGFRCAMTENS